MFDMRNASLHALEGLDRCRFDGTVHILLGSGSPHLHALQSKAASFSFQICFHQDATSAETIACLMQTDLAIGAGGVSALERSCLGVPSLVVEVADNQSGNVSALAASGAARRVEWSCLRDPMCLAKAIENALGDPQARSAMALAGQLLIDGRGAQRIALALAPEKTASGATIMLRKICAGDVDRVFSWQHEPEARQYSRNPQPPTRSEHETWFARTLADPAVLFCMVLLNDNPVGTVRLAPADTAQPDGQNLYEVSILVAEKFRGQGVGATALRSLHRLAPEAVVDAYVLHGNAASHRLFRSLGYAPVSGGYRYTPRAGSTVTVR
jgi:RimJ/RimL family protein N-acetyltransferase